jgi:Peptidase family S41
MRHAQLAAVLLWFAHLACASGTRSSRSVKLPRLVLRERHCDAVSVRRIPLQFVSLGLDPSLIAGAPTITKLDVFRKTVVLVNDNYYDPERIGPVRMLTAIVNSLADFSNGALRVDGSAVVATSGERWTIPTPSTIWEIPLALRDLGGFLLKHVPPQNPLARGKVAEVLATSALLSTLDPYSVLLPPAAFSKQGDGQVAAGSIHQAPETAPVEGITLATLPEGILHLRVGPFLRNTPDLIRAALEKSGQGSSGLILDLRGNRGGMLEATVQLIDFFVPSGTMLILNGRNWAEAKVAEDDALTSEHQKLIVLVDSSTSSGGEMVAGALRFSDRAILLGEPTSGNALVQALYEYRDRETNELSGLRLSIAEALLPGEHVFEGVGLAPDLVVTTGSQHGTMAAPGCSPVGETLATVHYEARESDPTVALASRIIRMAPTAARADLLAAARAVAASGVQARASSAPVERLGIRDLQR